MSKEILESIKEDIIDIISEGNTIATPGVSLINAVHQLVDIEVEDDAIIHKWFKYDENDKVEYVWTNSGDLIIFEHDEDGNLIHRSDRNIKEWFVYDENGNCIKYHNDADYSITRRYDENGFETDTIDSDGIFTSFEYNENGDIISEKINDKIITSWKYNAHGNLIEKNTELNKIEYMYNDGKIFKEVYTSPAVEKESVVNLTYDDNDRIIKSVDSNGNVQELEYNESGNLSYIKSYKK